MSGLPPVNRICRCRWEAFPGSAVLKNGAEEIANFTQPQIRLLRVHDRASNHPLPDLVDSDEVWTLCTPDTAADFSAVAYFFGREIQRQENGSIGLIDDTWGGTPAEAWISLETISADASLMPAFGVCGAECRKGQPTTKLSSPRQEARTTAARAVEYPLRVNAWRIRGLSPGRRLTSTTAWLPP